MPFVKLKSVSSECGGFTLVELLLTLILLATIALFAIPMMQHLLTDNRAVVGVNRLVGALEFARSEAIRRGMPTRFCASVDQSHCSGNWADGQIVTTSKQPLRVFPKLPAQDTLTWRGSLSKNHAIEFLPSGFTAGQNGSFHLCPQGNPTYARAIIIDKTGRVRVNKTGTAAWPLNCVR